jgi:2-polyprenyl-6-methoxyphenol hydroxylase-like FAD-dependent oxidoreductase
MGSIQDIPLVSATKTPATSISTDLLIVGAGPAGASLACFLARYGLKGIVLSAAPGTADTPRAHMNNMAAMECLRDIGLYEECLRLGNMGDTIKHYRWCETFAGEEYARNYAWGYGDRAGDYETVSPCTHMDLPQSLLEPILVKYATLHGFNVRFHTELLGFSEDDDGKYTCIVHDHLTNLNYQIKTRFLFGADGGRSLVMRELGLPMTAIPGGGLAFNVLFKCDLSDYMAHRQGNLHWCIRMERDYPFMSVLRMVKPWHEWMMVCFPKGPDVPVPERSHTEWKEIIEDFVGISDLDVEVLGVSKWLINETSADVVSKGNV